MAISNFRAVIPAGGAGTRLWPLSRASHPKFLLDLTGAGRSLLQQTVDRLSPLATHEGIMVVTGEKHSNAVHKQLPEVAPTNVLLEPSPRDSMAAIGLAVAVLARREGRQVVVGSFAADHVIAGQETFDNAVSDAIDAANEGYIATIGLQPTRASMAFGYIHAGEPLPEQQARSVEAFVEKPEAEVAEEYFASGKYFWNAGMFIFTAGTLLDHLQRLQPGLYAGVTEIAKAWDTDRRVEVMGRVWPHLTKIAIDHAIAEPVAAEGGVAVVPGTFAWDDVGDFAALRQIVNRESGRDTLGDFATGDEPLIVDADTPLVASRSGRKVVVLGIDEAVVVDTPDALLVTKRENAQQVKGIVDVLRESGREDLL